LLSVGIGGVEEKRLENYIVSGLVDFDDISYDAHADLLYNFATQIVKHFESYLSEGETAKVLRYHQREIARFIHAQMQDHFWEEPSGYETKINAGFTELKPSAYEPRRSRQASEEFFASPQRNSWDCSYPTRRNTRLAAFSPNARPYQGVREAGLVCRSYGFGP
jgi:type III restriction enzyme